MVRNDAACSLDNSTRGPSPHPHSAKPLSSHTLELLTRLLMQPLTCRRITGHSVISTVRGIASVVHLHRLREVERREDYGGLDIQRCLHNAMHFTGLLVEMSDTLAPCSLLVLL
jgi:hypothetical protein